MNRQPVLKRFAWWVFVLALTAGSRLSAHAGDWWAPGVGWGAADSPAFVLNARIANATGDGATGLVLNTRGGIGLEGAAVSGAFGVDGREAQVVSIAISGAAAVVGGDAATYTCRASYADGSQADITSLCGWTLVGAVPSGVRLSGPRLQTARTLFPESVQIRATYKRPEGQWASAPFMVNIAGGRLETMLANVAANSTVAGVWDLNALAITLGATGVARHKWYLDGAILPGQTGSRLTAYRVTGATGSRKLRVEVTDDLGRTAVAEETIPFNKPAAPREPEFVYPASDPVDGKTLDSLGADFAFRSGRKAVGLVIITHGLLSEGTIGWIQSLGLSIGDRLQVQEKKPVPNICLYDWSERADPFRMDSYNLAADKSLFGLIGKAPADAMLAFYDVLAIHPFAVTQGQRLADWIRAQVAAGNIDPAAPIHLIGHSAGGFVMGECAFLLKDRNIIQGLVQVTSLDTPYVFPGDAKVFQLAKSAGSICRAERYHYGIWPGFAWLPGLIELVGEGNGYYKRSLWSLQWNALGAHAWVHEWYDHQTAEAPGQEQDGFYYSPFMGNGFHGRQTSQASPNASIQPLMSAGSISNTPLTDFETFGAVILTDGLYRVTEDANAGLFKNLVLPVGAQSVKFSYRFASAGDGDYLVVYWGTNGMPLYIGSDLPISRDGFMQNEAPVNMFAGQTNKLTFILVSRGQPNAVLELKDIALTISNDPDYDGLTTSEETALGTDPLNADTDGDGVGDYDEVHTYFTNPLLADSDEDGVNDYDEIRAGSNPNDPHSCFAVTAVTSLPTGGVRLTWQGKLGRQYRIHRSDKLGNGVYTTLATGLPGIEPQMSFDDIQGNPSAFYWVEQEP